MTTRYQKSHIEDVADLFRRAFTWAQEKNVSSECLEVFVETFADLFAADNPEVCRYCEATEATAKVRCVGHEGDPFHNFEGGFDPDAFLEACGLEESK